MTNSSSADHPQEPARVIQAAIDAFNRGDVNALTPHAGNEADARSSDVPRRGSPEATVFARGEGTISVRHISCLDPRRVFCALVTRGGFDVAGIYSVNEGRITDARYFFSDFEMLATVGIIEERHLEVAAVAPGSH